MAKILHVEDNALWRDIVKSSLEEAGHQVLSFSALPPAVKAYEEGNFDLVICDGNLVNDNDGVRWAEQLHSQGQKTVVVSGNAKTQVPFVSKGAFDAKKILCMLE